MQIKSLRVIGISYIVLYILFTYLECQIVFSDSGVSDAFRGGALFFENTFRRRRWITPALGAGIVITGILFAPLLMPILPPATFVQTYEVLTPLGNGGAGQANSGPFPQYLGDRFGWDTMTSTVGWRLQFPQPAGKVGSLHFHCKLRGSERSNFSQENLWPTTRDQRPQQLLYLGTWFLQREGHHHGGIIDERRY